MHLSQGNFGILEQESLRNDPNVVANYLKRVLRQMKEPLIPQAQYDELGKLTDIDDLPTDIGNRKIKQIVETMPEIN